MKHPSRQPKLFLRLASVTCAIFCFIALSASAQSDAQNKSKKKSAAPTATKPLSPLEAARTMQVPKGFNVTLFAGEPDLVQPIGFCIDDRGRLWVAEANNYPDKKAGKNDRIVIYEDTDGDGVHDKRTVFYDKLEYVSGIEVGFGGAWIMSLPHFYFIPDKDYDGVPDGDPVVLLDGFGRHGNAHNIANGFAWGPDGWLYATHGRTNWSLVGKPGTPDDKRLRLDGGVWRYHPLRHEAESFSDGTTNPWGVDFDEYGQAFTCNCVNPHLYHMIQGAHYEPWRNRKSSQYAYQRIDTIADHLHFAGKKWQDSRKGTPQTLALGGGHAHCGTMVYLGDNWPFRYRNTVFMNNLHGKRINNDLLLPKGSGYTASHSDDFLFAKDPWFVGVTLAYGPDGAVFVSDFSNTGECHHTRNTQKTTGRIFKISYGKIKPQKVDITRLNDDQLVALHEHDNAWHSRHARKELQRRAAAGKDMSKVHAGMHKLFETAQHAPLELRAVWTLHVTGGLDEAMIQKMLDEQGECCQYVRGWAVQLELEDRRISDDMLKRFIRLADEDDSPVVRLFLASGLQRLPIDKRWDLAAALLTHAEDAEDQNLPLMIWYGIEPAVASDKDRAVKLLAGCKIPLVRSFIARRLASIK